MLCIGTRRVLFCCCCSCFFHRSCMSARIDDAQKQVHIMHHASLSSAKWCKKTKHSASRLSNHQLLVELGDKHVRIRNISSRSMLSCNRALMRGVKPRSHTSRSWSLACCADGEYVECLERPPCSTIAPILRLVRTISSLSMLSYEFQ